jgi:uncharacterized protein YggU (UPF0235/DUF167 family)
MITPAAIRYVASKGAVQLFCRVKPGVSANRQGVAAVTSDAIEVCVAAQARDGDANKAVRDVIAAALRVPKSDVEITKGSKGREKQIAINVGTARAGDDEVERVKALLLGSVSR